MDTIERSVQAYRVEANIGFSEIKNVVDYISSLRNENPSNVLLDIDSGTDFLFLSDNGLRYKGDVESLWIKFGWARRRGLPETLDTKTGQTEVLRLPSGVYLFEPAHFVIFEYNDNVILLHEYNQYAPRPTRLCHYIAEFYKRMKNNLDLKVKISLRHMFVKNLDELLRGYDIVKSIRIELETSGIKVASRVLGESETVLEFLSKTFKPSTIVLGWKSAPKGELEISIDDILNMFYELEPHLKTFKVRVKRSVLGRSIEIDLKKSVLTFRRYIKLARDEQGNLLRSTDTSDAVNVLVDTITEVLNQL